MAKQTWIAVAVAGARNVTKITSVRPLCKETLDSFADSVRKRPAGKLYYVFECSERGAQNKKGDPLFVWHVGDGFAHRDGWWVETE